MFIRKPLFYMADDGGSAGAGDGGTGDGGAQGGGSGGAGGDQGAKPDEGKTFSQADVDRIIAGRLAKFADYDATKQQLTGYSRRTSPSPRRRSTPRRTRAARRPAPRLPRKSRSRCSTTPRGVGIPTTTRPARWSFISLRKFVKDDGSVDRDAIKSAVERLVPEKGEVRPAPSFGGGPRKSDTKPEATPGIGRLRAAYADTTK